MSEGGTSSRRASRSGLESTWLRRAAASATSRSYMKPMRTGRAASRGGWGGTTHGQLCPRESSRERREGGTGTMPVGSMSFCAAQKAATPFRAWKWS
eukprot:scaffold280629_cov36-Tisochrysis_lutea.AAC.5